MKPVLFITILSLSALLLSVSGNAQIYEASLHAESDVGIKAGGNFQQLVASAFDHSYHTGFVGGIYAGKQGKKAGFHVEALVSNSHYTTEKPVSYGFWHLPGSDSTSKGDFKALYISIPALVEIKILKKKHTYFEFGPQYNYMLSFTDQNGVYTKQFKNDKIFKPSEFCLVVGVNTNLPRHLNLGIRFIKGITNVNEGTYYRANDAWQINTAQLTLSYKLLE